MDMGHKQYYACVEKAKNKKKTNEHHFNKLVFIEKQGIKTQSKTYEITKYKLNENIIKIFV